MKPIVNGIENDYSEKIDFRWIKVETNEGFNIFSDFSLRVHPSCIFLNSEGEIFWQSFGERPGEEIREQFEKILLNSHPT